MRPEKGRDLKWYVVLCAWSERRVAEKVVSSSLLVKDENDCIIKAGPFSCQRGAADVIEKIKKHLG